MALQALADEQRADLVFKLRQLGAVIGEADLSRREQRAQRGHGNPAVQCQACSGSSAHHWFSARP
jgi:hypothetical protein